MPIEKAAQDAFEAEMKTLAIYNEFTDAELAQCLFAYENAKIPNKHPEIINTVDPNCTTSISIQPTQNLEHGLYSGEIYTESLRTGKAPREIATNRNKDE